MRIYNMPRQSGKTTMLVNWLAESDNHILIVHSFAEADRIRREHPDVAGQIVGIDTVKSGFLRGHHNKVYAIDNLDLILPQLLGSWGNEIGPITYTGDYSYGN